MEERCPCFFLRELSAAAGLWGSLAATQVWQTAGEAGNLAIQNLGETRYAGGGHDPNALLDKI